MFVLFRCLSALAHWSPIFGETDFLPMLAFPFVKLFQNNQLICFEIVATILGEDCCSPVCAHSPDLGRTLQESFVADATNESLEDRGSKHLGLENGCSQLQQGQQSCVLGCKVRWDSGSADEWNPSQATERVFILLCTSAFSELVPALV